LETRAGERTQPTLPVRIRRKGVKGEEGKSTHRGGVDGVWWIHPFQNWREISGEEVTFDGKAKENTQRKALGASRMPEKNDRGKWGGEIWPSTIGVCRNQKEI